MTDTTQTGPLMAADGTPLKQRLGLLFDVTATFVVALVTSFLILSIFVTPLIHQSFFISATSKLLS